MVAVTAQGVRHRSDDSWHASETVTGGQHVSRYAIVLSGGALLAMSWFTTVLAQVDDDGARDQDARHGILTVRRPQATGRLDSAARPNRAWHAPNVAAVHCRAECRGTPLGWFAAFNCQF